MAKMTEEKRQERIRVRAYHMAKDGVWCAGENLIVGFSPEEIWRCAEKIEQMLASVRSDAAKRSVETKRRNGVFLNGADTKRWNKLVANHGVVLEVVQEA